MSNPKLDSGGIGGGGNPSSSNSSDGDDTKQKDQNQDGSGSTGTGGSTPDDLAAPGGQSKTNASTKDPKTTGGGGSGSSGGGYSSRPDPGEPDANTAGSESSGESPSSPSGGPEPTSGSGLDEGSAPGTTASPTGEQRLDAPSGHTRTDNTTAEPTATGSGESESKSGGESGDPLVVAEEGAPDADNRIVERRLNRAATSLMENNESLDERSDFQLRVTDSGTVDFAGLTQQGREDAIEEDYIDRGAESADVQIEEETTVSGATDGRLIVDQSPSAETETTTSVDVDWGDQPDEVETPDGEHSMTRDPGKGPDIGTDKFQEAAVEARLERRTDKEFSVEKTDDGTFAVRQEFDDSPTGMVSTPGDAAEMRNRSSDSLPGINERLEARVARGNENLSPGDVNVDRQEEGMFAPEASNQDASAFKVTLTEEGRQKLREQAEQDQEEQFGDYQVTVPFTGGKTVEDYLEVGASGYSKTVQGASSALFDKGGAGETGGIASESIIAEGLEAVGQDAAATTFEEGLRSFGKGTFEGAAALGNVPGVAAGVKEGGELVGYGVGETAEGRGGEFFDQTGVAAGEATAGAVDYAKANPVKFAGQAVGSLAGSYTIMSGAAKVSPRVGAATRYAIQPGEELATGLATKLAKRTATGQRALNKIPGGRLDNEEIAIAAGAKAKSKVGAGVNRIQTNVDTPDVGGRIRGELEARSRANTGGGTGKSPFKQLVDDDRGMVQLTKTKERSRDGDTETTDDEDSSVPGEEETLEDARDAYQQELDEDAARRVFGMSNAELDAELGRIRRKQQLKDVRAADVELETRTSGIGDLESRRSSIESGEKFDTSRFQTERARQEFEQEMESDTALETGLEARTQYASELAVSQDAATQTQQSLGVEDSLTMEQAQQTQTEQVLEMEAVAENVQELAIEAETEFETDTELETDTEFETEFEADTELELEAEYEYELESETEFEYESEKEAELPPPPGDGLPRDSGAAGSGSFENVFEYSVASSRDVLTGGLDER